jgi:hypothetical protein
VALDKKEPGEAREQSEHVLYEIQMFYALLRYFETGEVDRAVAGLAQAGLPVRNAVTEAFEIHGRQLIEFLTAQRQRGLATAGDFTRGKWDPPPERQDLQRLEERFSERVAHLSWQRAKFTDEERLVLTHEIESKIRPVLIRFLDRADAERLCEGFVDEARWALTSPGPETERRGAQTFEAATRVATTQAPQINAGTATGALRRTTEQVRFDE